MDKYNHWIGKLAGFVFAKGKPYAITLGRKTYFSCPFEMTSLRWRLHEKEHRKQWCYDGKVRFSSRYVWQWATRGFNHDRIDYEKEAAEAEVI
jgi:hypothetical protein